METKKSGDSSSIPRDMREEYQPTRKEVLEEIIKTTGKNFLEATATTFIIPYVIPTIVREYKKGAHMYDDEEAKLDTLENIGVSAGAITGIGLDIAQVYAYTHVVNNHPEILLLPILTNVASGIYELVRGLGGMYNHAKQRVIARREAKKYSEESSD